MALVNPYLQVDGLTKRIGDRMLFEHISFGIAEGQRVGLIAKNGTGKSTLLNIIGGKDGYDEGSVVFRRDLNVGYLEQAPSYPPDLTVIEACFSHGNAVTNLIREYENCMNTPGNPRLEEILDRMEREKAWDYENRAKQILSQLKIHSFNQKISTLSGGQLKRVALANVLITEPDLLILDEPTNHLDLEMIEWLEGYLKRSKLSLLMVTHDRYFLDRVCSVILELDDCTVYTYKGNYSYYLQKRQERIDASNAEVARANNLYRTELDWMRRMPCARGHKARYREEAFYELEKVAKRKTVEQSVSLEVKSSYIGSKIFEADYISKSYGPDKVILKDFFYTFSRYEKMGIVGNNGTGKSTFIKILLGLVKPDSGRVVVGETVKFGYYSQDGMVFDEQMKVIDAVANKLKSPALLMGFSKLMDAAADCFVTSLSQEQISALVRMQLGDLANWDIQSYTVTGSGAKSTKCYSAKGQSLYVMKPDENSVNEAKALVAAVLGGEDKLTSTSQTPEKTEVFTPTTDPNAGASIPEESPDSVIAEEPAGSEAPAEEAPADSQPAEGDASGEPSASTEVPADGSEEAPAGSTESPSFSMPTQEQVEQAASSLHQAASTVLDALFGSGSGDASSAENDAA